MSGWRCGSREILCGRFSDATRSCARRYWVGFCGLVVRYDRRLFSTGLRCCFCSRFRLRSFFTWLSVGSGFGRNVDRDRARFAREINNGFFGYLLRATTLFWRSISRGRRRFRSSSAGRARPLCWSCWILAGLRHAPPNLFCEQASCILRGDARFRASVWQRYA